LSGRAPQKSQVATVRRPRRTDVLSWICRQPQRRASVDQLDVKVEVLAVAPVPGKSDLITVGRESRLVRGTGKSSEWNNLCRRWWSLMASKWGEPEHEAHYRRQQNDQ